MAVDWDEDQDSNPATGTGWQEANFNYGANDNFIFSPTFTDETSNSFGFTATWDGKHDYSTPGAGTYTVRVLVYHGGSSGNDGSGTDAATFTVVIPTTGGLTVIKQVLGGTKPASDFNIHVKSGGTDVAGSPQPSSSTGTSYTLTQGSYTVSEDPDAHYTSDLSACGTNGAVTITAGATTTCTVANTYFNTPPLANDSSLTTDEDTPASGSVSGTDADGDVLLYAILTGPLHGLLSSFDTGTGAFTYTPSANYNGPDSFTFSAFDGAEDDEGEVTITVNLVNDQPVALADAYSTNEDTPVTTGNVLANDTDVDGDTLSVSAADSTSAQGGTVADNGNGTFDYTPALNFNGSDTFNYTVSDGNGGTDTAVVTINVSNDNDAPVAADDSYSTDEDVTLVEPADGVLDNDTDVDGNSLTAELDTDVSNGSLTLNADGSFEYTPDADFNGTDSFTYHASDGTADSSVVTVSITVDPVNDAPVATGQSLSTPQNLAVSGVLGATDVDGDTLSYSITVSPTKGTLTFFNAGSGAFTYTPGSNYTGSDSFTFTANDGLLDSNPATVDITVTSSPEDTLALCSDGIDNDNDTLIDLEDPDCAGFPLQITISPLTETNAVNDAHTFTVTVQQGSGPSVPIVGVPVTVSFTPSITPTSDTCATATDSSGQCAVTINSAAPGTFTAHASTSVISGATTFYIETDGSGGNSSDATKEYVGAQIALSPLTATNDINQTHQITATIVINPGPNETLAPDGQLVTFTLANSSGATAAFVGGVDSCTTSGGTGACSVTIDSATAGTVTVNGFASVVVSGVTLERDTDPSTAAPAGPGGTGPAVKTYVDNTPAPSTPSSGGGGGGGGGPGCAPGSAWSPSANACVPTATGRVLGAATSTLGVTCGLYMNQHLMQGSKKNNSGQVTRLQQFLIKHGYGTFTATGYFGPLTLAAVKAFQAAYADVILKPWDISAPTGLVYLTTARQLNLIECPELVLPMPELVPWNKNPNAQ